MNPDTVIHAISLLVLCGFLVHITMQILQGYKTQVALVELKNAERKALEARVQLLQEQCVETQRQRQESWEGWRKFKVVRVVDEAQDIRSFYFQPHDERRLPPFKPGQYLTFRIDHPDLPGKPVRCYSLSDAHGKGETYRCSIKRIPPMRGNPPGVVSNFFHDRIVEGAILDVKAPGGHFFLDTSRSTPIVLVAGGIGVTPIISMLNATLEDGSDREVWLFYGVRNSSEQAFKPFLEEAARSASNVNLRFCYSRPLDTDVEGKDYHHKGFVCVDLFKEVLPSNNYDYFICGPPPMMNMMVADLEDWSVPKDRIHFEAFGPATVKKVAPKAEPSAEGIKVEFIKSGKTLVWNDSSGSLLEFAEANGVALDSGCRAGNCGTCVVAINKGNVKSVVSSGAKTDPGTCLTCISVPAGPLALDA